MNTSTAKIVIIGATSAIAEHCARLWAMETPAEIILVGRNQSKTELVAADLAVRTPHTRITTIEADFRDPAKIQALADHIVSTGSVDIVLIAHGSLPDQELCQVNLTECKETLEVNGISPVLFAEAFAGHMKISNKGTLVIIGSVAGDRGRKSNYVYGAAKGLVTRYAQGLQHRFAGTAVSIVLVKPGPTETPMTAHLKQKGARLASVESVAKQIVEGARKQRPLVYAPGKWWLIMMIIRHIPNVLFNKMDI
jgi:decaprenylphospho-beta-D-erythro-pentofuranosid-2-ulose 2-reductase